MNYICSRMGNALSMLRSSAEVLDWIICVGVNATYHVLLAELTLNHMLILYFHHCCFYIWSGAHKVNFGFEPYILNPRFQASPWIIIRFIFISKWQHPRAMKLQTSNSSFRWRSTNEWRLLLGYQLQRIGAIISQPYVSKPAPLRWNAQNCLRHAS